VTVIDGATNTTTTVAAGTEPIAVAVNPVTNKIYVANYRSDNVTVIDGATNLTTTLTAGTQPYAVAVNPVTSRIYVANSDLRPDLHHPGGKPLHPHRPARPAGLLPGRHLAGGVAVCHRKPGS
jgi:YVTN family beta-propeller protein